MSSEPGDVLNRFARYVTADNPTWFRKPGEGLEEAHLNDHTGAINFTCQVNYDKFYLSRMDELSAVNPPTGD